LWSEGYDVAGNAPYGTGPRATPAIDGNCVYTLGAFGQLACWSMKDGKRLWLTQVSELGARTPTYGHSCSPLVWQDKVIVQIGGQALAVALDKATGKKSWASAAGRVGYAAPALASVGGKAQVLIFAAGDLVSLDPAKGGKLWQVPWPSDEALNCSTPVVQGDKVIITSWVYNNQGGTGLVEIKPAGAKLAWSTKASGASNNDPVILDGCIYQYSGYAGAQGTLDCLDLATGRRLWTTNDCGGPGNVLAVDGLLMCLSNRGKLYLLRPSRKGPEKVTEFQALNATPAWTAPVIAGGRLYLRAVNQLVCYALSDASAKARPEK
jgi:outer membrane protein assembly factor BamB